MEGQPSAVAGKEHAQAGAQAPVALEDNASETPRSGAPTEVDRKPAPVQPNEVEETDVVTAVPVLQSNDPGADDSRVDSVAPLVVSEGDAHLDADLAITLGRPKTAAKPMGNLSDALKGRSMLRVNEKANASGEKELADTSQLRGAYDAESVQLAWSALVAHMRTQNKVGLAATLANGGFAFADPAIVFTVANEVQYEELKECATELLHFVRTQAGNGGLSLEVKVAEGEAPSVFLTPKDRYVKWANENPALETLRKRLDLDLG